MSEIITDGFVSEYRPQEGRQALFVGSWVDECAWLGQANTGKGISYFLDFLKDVHRPAHNGIMFRRAYRDLEDLMNKAEKILPSYGGKFDGKLHRWLFPSGARLWMAYLEDEKTVEGWLGHEFSCQYWDELGQFSLHPFLYMTRNLRCADRNIPKRRRSGANPFGFGAPWVWGRYVESLDEGQIAYFTTVGGRDVRLSPAFYDETGGDFLKVPLKERGYNEIREWLDKTPKQERGFSRQWWKGIRSENLLGDQDYERTLDQLPTEAMRQAYKFGILVKNDHPDQLIHKEWIDAACEGKNETVVGQKSFGMDYSEGGDLCVMYRGSGNQVNKAWEWGDKAFLKHPVVARWLVDFIRDEGKYQILGGIDTVGTGAGVYTCIGDIDSGMSERINPIRHKDLNLDKKDEESRVKLHFKNIQDQIMWKLREDFKFGRIDLSPLLAQGGYYPNLHLLKEELTAFRFKENKNSDGTIWISSSNDLRKSNWPGGEPCLGRSPDRAKAFAIWNYVRDWKPSKARFAPNKQDYEYEKPASSSTLRPEAYSGYV